MYRQTGNWAVRMRVKAADDTVESFAYGTTSISGSHRKERVFHAAMYLNGLRPTCVRFTESRLEETSKSDRVRSSHEPLSAWRASSRRRLHTHFYALIEGLTCQGIQLFLGIEIRTNIYTRRARMQACWDQRAPSRLRESSSEYITQEQAAPVLRQSTTQYRESSNRPAMCFSGLN